MRKGEWTMKIIASCFSALFLVLSLGQAQNIAIQPPECAALAGYSSTNLPFGRYDKTGQNQKYRQARLLQVHDAISKNTISIKGMAFRRAHVIECDWPGWKAQVEITLSTAPVTSTTMSKTFANNIGKDAKTVISRKWIHFPASMYMARLIYPFMYILPFDTGKAFVLQGGKPLAWDAKVFDNDVHSHPYAYRGFNQVYAYMRNYSYGPYVKAGKGCFAPRQWRSSYCYTGCRWDSNYPGREFTIYGSVYYGPQFGLAVVGISLGYIAPGIPINSQGCLLYLDPSRIIFLGSPAKLDSRGYHYWSGYPSSVSTPPIAVFPDNQALYGQRLYLQVFTVDNTFTNVYSTNFVKLQLPYPWKKMGMFKIGYVYAYYNANAVAGYLSYSPFSRRALITAFYY